MRRCLLDIVHAVFCAHHKQVVSISCDFVQNAQVPRHTMRVGPCTDSHHRGSQC